MPFVLFKAGDYGTKGKWSNEQLSNLITNKKELDVIPFHTSEFTKLGMLRNEIPVIGKFKNISVKDDEIIANDVEIFNRGEFKDRKVDRLSVEIENGEIRIYPTFNSQTRELSFDIKNDNVRVSCE